MSGLKPKVGDLRPSQLLYTYGVGAIVDLPNLSVMVMGLEDWPADPGLTAEIVEDRLLAAVQWKLGRQVKKLLSPPVTPESSGPSNPFEPEQQVGAPVAAFPRWMLCPACRMLAPLSSGLFEFKAPSPFHPDRAMYVHSNCSKPGKPPTVVPARFMTACKHGHLDDFPWREFTHKGPTNCTGVLTLSEYGPSGEARDLEVKCSCGARRRLAEAFGESGKQSMPTCRGRRPHLRDFEDGGCKQQAQAILLGASNSWFPVIMSALALPGATNKLALLVEANWATLKHATQPVVVTAFRGSGNLKDFGGFSDDDIWTAVAAYRQAQEAGDDDESGPLDLRTPEWEMLIRPTEAPQTDDFQLSEVAVPQAYQKVIEQVALVERLREVQALVGFTRIDAPSELGEPGTVDEARFAGLSRQRPVWVPASEVRGEGIFIRFNEAKIESWLGQAVVQRRSDSFLESHRRWCKARGIEEPDKFFPTLRYVLLHTFSHALMRQLALECGYTAASIRERIYSRPANDPDGPPMAGLLLYTSAADSEGTLGGLVSLGETEQLGRHIQTALRAAHLCSSDPLCAEHEPSRQGRTLHAAACHACLFAPETSCERGNKYLDRSLLTATVTQTALSFFADVG